MSFDHIMKIQTRDPHHLKGKYSPALRRLPELPDNSEEFLGLAAGLKKGGFTCPILIDQDDQVIDDHSRSLLRAALRWQLKEVPVQPCSSDDAPLLRISRLAHYRHLSKAAIAYLALPDLDQAFEIARAKMLENLRKPQQTSESTQWTPKVETVDELAVELGIGRSTLFDARKVRAAFEDKKKYSFNVKGGPQDGAEVEMTLREWYEPRILRSFVGGEHEQNRPMGLGGILAGITAIKEGNRDKYNPKGKGQLSLFESNLDFTTGWKYWAKLTPKDRDQHFKNFEDQLEFVPEAQRDELADYLEKLADKVRKAAKEGK